MLHNSSACPVIQLGLEVGTASSLEALGGLDPSLGLQAIFAFPFICSQPGGALGREFEDHSRGLARLQGGQGGQPAQSPAVLAPGLHRLSLQPWALLSWPPGSHALSTHGLHLLGFIRNSTASLGFLQRRPGRAPFQLRNISLPCHLFPSHFSRRGEYSS